MKEVSYAKWIKIEIVAVTGPAYFSSAVTHYVGSHATEEVASFDYLRGRMGANI